MKEAAPIMPDDPVTSPFCPPVRETAAQLERRQRREARLRAEQEPPPPPLDPDDVPRLLAELDALAGVTAEHMLRLAKRMALDASLSPRDRLAAIRLVFEMERPPAPASTTVLIPSTVAEARAALAAAYGKPQPAPHVGDAAPHED